MLDARAFLTVTVFALAGAVQAQPRRAPAPSPANLAGPSATDLLNARRQLGLSPRQVARLDSIERVGFAQRTALRTRLASRRDSLCANRRPCVLSQQERQELQGELTGNRASSAWRSDSAGRVLAMSLLDSTQRGRVQGWRLRQGQARLRQGQAQMRAGAQGGRAWERGARIARGTGRAALRNRDQRGQQPMLRRGFAPGFGPPQGFRERRRPEFAPRRGFGPESRFDPRFDRGLRRDGDAPGDFQRSEAGRGALGPLGTDQGMMRGRRGAARGVNRMRPDSAAADTTRR